MYETCKLVRFIVIVTSLNLQDYLKSVKLSFVKLETLLYNFFDILF